MALHTVHLAPYCAADADTAFSGQITPATTLSRHVAKRWRDDIKAKFTTKGVLNDVTGYTVSDIFTWAGTSNTEGVGFIVRDNANGVEWVVCFTEQTASAGASPTYFTLGGSGANLRAHVKQMGETAHTTGNTYGPVIFFNKAIATATVATSIAFTDGAALTFAGGDYTVSAVAFNTLGNLALLRPAHCEYGVEWNTEANNYFVPSMMTFCDVRAAMFHLVGYENATFKRWFMLSGLCCDPNDGGDADTSLVVHGEISNTNGKRVTLDASSEAYAFDVGGTLRVYDIDISPAAFGLHDQLIDEGGTDKADWKAVGIYNGSGGSGTKGTVMEECMVQIGAERSHTHLRSYKLFTDAETVVKYTARFAFMHEANTLFFPAPVDLGLKTLTDV